MRSAARNITAPAGERVKDARVLRGVAGNISGSMNFQDYFPARCALQSLAFAANSRGFPRNTRARIQSISRTSIDPPVPSPFVLSTAGDLHDSSGSAFLIGLWKCYDKNIVDRASVDFSHFYWPALIDFAFEDPLVVATTNAKFHSSAFHRDPT